MHRRGAVHGSEEVVTVRTWFRLQRGALWDQQPELAAACEIIANAIDRQQRPPLKPYYIGSMVWMLTEAEVHRQELIDQIKADMRRASQISKGDLTR